MPHDPDDSLSLRRRSGDTTVAKYMLPAIIGLVFSLAGAAILGLFALSSKVTRLESERHAKIEDVVRLETRLDALEKDVERLRHWMAGHSHGGTVGPVREAP